MPFDIGGFVYDTTFIQDYGKSGVITNGLVLYLDTAFAESYPKGGTTWYDLSGNGYNGTLTNGPTYSSVNGGSIAFDGTNDYISLPSFGIFDSNFSIDVSFLVTAYPPSTNYLESDGIASFGNEKALYLTFGDGGPIDSLSVRVNINSTWYNPVQTGTVLLDTWYLMTVTYNTTSGWKLYLNGTLKSSNSLTGTILNNSGTVPNELGAADYSNYPNRVINGSIGFFRLYSKELSSTEITQNYNATKGRFGL